MNLPYLLSLVLWIAWGSAFFGKSPRGSRSAVVKDASARWGMVIEAIAIAIVFLSPDRHVPWWRIALGIPLALLAIVMTHSAVRHLAKQWRIDAALNADHELIRTGPYRLVRHPIYAGMFAMMLALGALISRWQAIVAATVIYVAGTEIRVRAEDGLLRARFGEEFENWSRHVWAYVPFLR